MKKLLKPARKKGFKSTEQDEEVIDLEEKVPEKLKDSDENDDEVLDLTDEVTSKKQESLETGILELTNPAPSLSPFTDSVKDNAGKTSDNVIHLSDKVTADMTTGESEEIEAISQDEILDLETDEVFNTGGDEDLTQLTKQLESAISTSYDDEEDESIETLPEANLIEVEDYEADKGGIEGFALLPEAEPGMADNIDSLGFGDLDEETTFADIGAQLTGQAPDLSMETEDLTDEAYNLDDDSMDEDISEAALELNRAMKADRDGAYRVDASDELSDEIQSIRNKLDNVFPEEDSQDSLAFFNASKQNDEDEDEFDTDELILPPFDENEAGAMGTPFGAKPFEAKADPIDLTSDLKVTPSKTSQTASSGDSFDNSINFYKDRSASPKNKIDPFDTDVSISNDELEAAIQRIIETKFGNKIERMIVQAIEKAVSREIAKIKKAILDESDSIG